MWVHYRESAKDAAPMWLADRGEMGQKAVAIQADLQSVDAIRKLF
jgi:hypothetical protein